jgi:hypothetical protein
MALTLTRVDSPISKKQVVVFGDRKIWFGTITFDNSYPTGGEILTKDMFGFDAGIDMVIVGANPAGSRLATYDPATRGLKLFTAVGTEAGNASDQSTIVVPILAIGK